MGRWFAQYDISKYGQKSNFTNDDINAASVAGYDVVIHTFGKINNGGHMLLVFFYNDINQIFETKNLQVVPGWGKLKYTNDVQFDVLYNNMFYITEVALIQNHWASMWLDRWETGHDGCYGMLVICRHTDLFATDLIPGPNSRISLGIWYG